MDGSEHDEMHLLTDVVIYGVCVLWITFAGFRAEEIFVS